MVRIIKWLQNYSRYTLLTIEGIFFLAFIVDITKIPIINFSTVINYKTWFLLFIPLILIVLKWISNKASRKIKLLIALKEFFNRVNRKNKFFYTIKEICSNISYILFSIFITFFIVRMVIISLFIANYIPGTNSRDFNQKIFFGVLTVIILFLIIGYFRKKEDITSSIILTIKTIIEFDILTFFFLYILIIIYSAISNQILFNSVGAVEIVLIVIIKTKISSNLSLKEFLTVINIKKILNVLQTITVFFIILFLLSIQFKGMLKTNKVTVLVTSAIILMTILLYWIDFKEIFGDYLFSSIMLIFAFFPIIAILLYEQMRVLGKINFSKIIFGLILATGAILLLVVSEDSQLINGIGLSNRRKLSNYGKQKIAKYKLNVSNGVIVATFINSMFSSVNNLTKWLATKSLLKIDENWIFLIMTISAMIIIILSAFSLSRLETKLFKYFRMES